MCNLFYQEHNFRCIVSLPCWQINPLTSKNISFTHIWGTHSQTDTHPDMCACLLPAPALSDSCTDRSLAERSSRDCSLHCSHDSLLSLRNMKTTVSFSAFISLILSVVSLEYQTPGLPLQLCPSSSSTRPGPHSQRLEPLVFTHTSAQPPFPFSHSFTSERDKHNTLGSVLSSEESCF